MLKKSILQVKSKKNTKRRKHTVNVDFSSSRTVAILYTEPFSAPKELEALISDLKKAGKEVDVLSFCRDRKIESLNYDHFVPSDISTNGKLRSDKIEKFTQKGFDFAICLDQSLNQYVEYVFSLLKTKCRVGLVPMRHELFDMVIASTQNEEDWHTNVMKYLKMIQHADN